MKWYLRVTVVLAVCTVAIPAIDGQEPAKPKAKIELRWLEDKKVEGLTENTGFQATCDPKSIVYAHKKPALVLTAAEVSEAQLNTHDFRGSGFGIVYTVTLNLTKKARESLAATCPDLESRSLTIMVDGKTWGTHRYEKNKDKPLVPEDCRAESFRPGIGFFSSKAEAERIVDALK